MTVAFLNPFNADPKLTWFMGRQLATNRIDLKCIIFYPGMNMFEQVLWITSHTE